jgi:hypothetical protein
MLEWTWALDFQSGLNSRVWDQIAHRLTTDGYRVTTSNDEDDLYMHISRPLKPKIFAYLLIKTKINKNELTVDLAEPVKAVEGVTSALVVSGPHDIIAQADADDMSEMARIQSDIYKLDWVRKVIVDIILA